MIRPRVSLGEFLGGVAVLAIPLGVFLPMAREMVASFGEEFRPMEVAYLASAIGVVAFNIQLLYWFSIILLRRWRAGRRRP